MNAKQIFKTVFLIAILLLLVMIGMYNRSAVTFSLPGILPRSISQPAGIMYFAFFAVGVLTGTILSAGGGKKGGASSSSSKAGKG